MDKRSLDAYLRKITTQKSTQTGDGKIHSKLREGLTDAVKKNPADTLLLSGGTDSSILAYLDPKIKAITVGLENAPDLKCAEEVALELKLEHHKRIVSIEEAFDAIPEVIKTLNKFDRDLPNDIAIYFGLKFAKEELKAKSVMTGDGADELFAGYDFMWNFEPANLDKYIRKLSQGMRFSSNALGSHFGLQIKQPYLDKEFKKFALEIPPEQKVITMYGRKYGKQVLREAFKEDKGFKGLPFGIIWRRKSPIVQGSGMSKLREIINSKISDEEFRRASHEYGIHLEDKEHLYYYKIYRKEVGKIPLAKEGEKVCDWCGAGMQFYHCRVCGYHVPIEEYLK